MRKTFLAAAGLLLCAGAYGAGDPVTYTNSQLIEMAATGERPNYDVHEQDVSSHEDLAACDLHLEEFINDSVARYERDAPPGNRAVLGYYTDKLKETSCIHVEAAGGRPEKWNLFRVTNRYHLPKWGEEDDDLPPHCQHDPNAPDCQGDDLPPHCAHDPNAPDCQSDAVPPHCAHDPNAPDCPQVGAVPPHCAHDPNAPDCPQPDPNHQGMQDQHGDQQDELDFGDQVDEVSNDDGTDQQAQVDSGDEEVADVSEVASDDEDDSDEDEGDGQSWTQQAAAADDGSQSASGHRTGAMRHQHGADMANEAVNQPGDDDDD